MLLTAAALASPAEAGDGVVTTASGRIAGAVTFLADGRLRAGDRAVAWKDVLLAAVNADGRTLPQPHCLRLVNGETWRGRIVAYGDGKVTFGRWGIHGIDKGLVRALDFIPNVPAGMDEVATLFRAKLRPLPGTVLWIDAARIAIDSPLGVLTVPREGTTRYVFARAGDVALPPGQDEVTLIDGSILRGRARPVRAGLKLSHAALGELDLPSAAIRTIRRRPAGTPNVTYLADVANPSVRTRPLTAGTPTGRLTVEPPAAAGARRGEVTQIRIEAGTVVRYRVSVPDGACLAACVGPGPRSRGQAALRIRVAGKLILEKKVSPGARPTAISVRLPAADEVTVDVSFSGPVRLPCAVVLGDARIVRP